MQVFKRVKHKACLRSCTRLPKTAQFLKTFLSITLAAKCANATLTYLPDASGALFAMKLSYDISY